MSTGHFSFRTSIASCPLSATNTSIPKRSIIRLATARTRSWRSETDTIERGSKGQNEGIPSFLHLKGTFVVPQRQESKTSVKEPHISDWSDCLLQEQHDHAACPPLCCFLETSERVRVSRQASFRKAGDKTTAFGPQIAAAVRGEVKGEKREPPSSTTVAQKGGKRMPLSTQNVLRVHRHRGTTNQHGA